MGKKITTIVSIILALVFISMIIVIYSIVNSTGQNSATELSLIGAKLNYIEKLEGKTVTGAEVINVIDNYNIANNNIKLSFVVDNAGKSFKGTGRSDIASYGWTSGLTQSTSGATVNFSTTTLKRANEGINITNKNYIQTSYKYKCTITRDGLDNLETVWFDRVL